MKKKRTHVYIYGYRAQKWCEALLKTKTKMHTGAHIYAHTCTYIRTYVYIYTHTRVHMYAHTYVIHESTDRYRKKKQYTQVCLYTHTRTEHKNGGGHDDDNLKN